MTPNQIELQRGSFFFYPALHRNRYLHYLQRILVIFNMYHAYVILWNYTADFSVKSSWEVLGILETQMYAFWYAWWSFFLQLGLSWYVRLVSLTHNFCLNLRLCVKQGRKWRVGRVGNCSPRFWRNRRRRREAAAARAQHYVLLAHPDLGSYLRPWYST